VQEDGQRKVASSMFASHHAQRAPATTTQAQQINRNRNRIIPGVTRETK
jgi:hypothetical protein